MPSAARPRTADAEAAAGLRLELRDLSEGGRPPMTIVAQLQPLVLPQLRHL